MTQRARQGTREKTDGCPSGDSGPHKDDSQKSHQMTSGYFFPCPWSPQLPSSNPPNSKRTWEMNVFGGYIAIPNTMEIHWEKEGAINTRDITGRRVKRHKSTGTGHILMTVLSSAWQWWNKLCQWLNEDRPSSCNFVPSSSNIKHLDSPWPHNIQPSWAHEKTYQ